MTIFFEWPDATPQDVADNAIETPDAPGVKMHHMVTIRLGGQPNSGINHVINGTGDPVISTQKATVE